MKKIIILSALIIMSGCSYKTNNVVSEDEVAYVQNDNMSVQIAMAAKKASNALVELAEIEKVRTPVTESPIVDNVPRSLKQEMSITWNGDLGSLVEKIADKAMYEYVELGVKPNSPILVQVDAIETELIEVLRNVGLQAGARANVVVDIENRNIEVHYVEVDKML